MFVEMYGLPDYRELDPTVLIGLTYSVFFGFMFGDVGQGLCLMIGGALLYRKKKTNRLAAIISRCGFFSTIFGFLFGSFFGFEDVIKPLWLRPAEATMTLPGIGNLNTVFIVAVAIGMGVILLTMAVNVINRVRMKEPGEALFDTNGIAGMVFYASAVLSIVLAMSGHDNARGNPGTLHVRSAVNRHIPEGTADCPDHKTGGADAEGKGNVHCPGIL
jgi:V/A-type H+-transporting ATPase subunit I